MDRRAERSALTEGQLAQQNGKMRTDFQVCNSSAAQCLKHTFTHVSRSAHSHETAQVLGDSQPLALVYFQQIVIYHLTQWFASSNWNNSSAFIFSELYGVNDSLISLASSITISKIKTEKCVICPLNQIFRLCSGPEQFVRFIFFECLSIFSFWPSFLDSTLNLTYLLYSFHTLSSFSYNSIFSLLLLIALYLQILFGSF